jgi:hypothetical protein
MLAALPCVFQCLSPALRIAGMYTHMPAQLICSNTRVWMNSRFQQRVHLLLLFGRWSFVGPAPVTSPAL